MNGARVAFLQFDRCGRWARFVPRPHRLIGTLQIAHEAGDIEQRCGFVCVKDTLSYGCSGVGVATERNDSFDVVGERWSH